ncbi:MAG: tetratricopeptide repeat protein [Myxococcota bacterium]
MGDRNDDTELDLDAKIEALQQAMLAKDGAAIAARLESIEAELDKLNPMMRGMTYAHVQSVLGKPDKAVAAVRDLLQLMPENAMAQYQLGCYCQQAGDDEGALEAFTLAVEHDASIGDAWINRGILLDAGGEPELAIESYRHAVLRSPAEVDAWRNLGNSLAAIGRYDEAIESYLIAVRLAPGDETLSFLVASAHQAKGDLAAANESLPPAMRQQLGEVVQVQVEADGRTLRCRFHATADQREARARAARGLLQVVAQEITEASEFPLRREGSFIVRDGEAFVLCDVDAVGTERPHRFRDATRAIETAASGSC